MAGAQSAQNIFPLSYKTASVSDRYADPVGFGNPLGYIGFQLVQPYNLYKMKSLKMHFRCKFDPSVATINQVVQKISVGSQVGLSVPDKTKPFIVTNFVPVAGVLDFTIDLSTLMSATGDDTIWLYFPALLVPGSTGWSGIYNQIQILIWKVDMLYQTIGVR